MLRQHRGTDRTEGSRPARKAQKVTGEKGWFLSRHLTLLLAEDGRCTMKSTQGRCRISSTIRVRKKFEPTRHRFKKPWNETLSSHSDPGGRAGWCCCPTSWLSRCLQWGLWGGDWGQSSAEGVPPLHLKLLWPQICQKANFILQSCALYVNDTPIKILKTNTKPSHAFLQQLE